MWWSVGVYVCFFCYGVFNVVGCNYDIGVNFDWFVFMFGFDFNYFVVFFYDIECFGFCENIGVCFGCIISQYFVEDFFFKDYFVDFFVVYFEFVVVWGVEFSIVNFVVDEVFVVGDVVFVEDFNVYCFGVLFWSIYSLFFIDEKDGEISFSDVFGNYGVSDIRIDNNDVVFLGYLFIFRGLVFRVLMGQVLMYILQFMYLF